MKRWWVTLLAVFWLAPDAGAAVSWLAELKAGAWHIQVELVPVNPFGGGYRPRLRLRGDCQREFALGERDFPLDVWRQDDQHYALVDGQHTYLIDLAKCTLQTLLRSAQETPGPGYQRIGAFAYNEFNQWVYLAKP